MLEDVLLIADKHREAAAVIVEEILKNKTDKYIVAISGRIRFRKIGINTPGCQSNAKAWHICQTDSY